MRILRIAVVALVLVILIFAVTLVLYTGNRYQSLIYPGVSVSGIPIGDMTPFEARTRLSADLPPLSDKVLVVTAADGSWQLPWSDAGVAYNLDAAVDAAYAIERDRPWWTAVFVLLKPPKIDVPVTSTDPDPALVRAFVDGIAEQVALAPQDVALRISGAEVLATPASAGRRLDPEYAVESILAALQDGAAEIALDTEALRPAVVDPDPALAKMRALLDAPFTLIVDDPLTRDADGLTFHEEFVLPPETLGGWLSARAVAPNLHLAIDQDAVRAWVGEVSARISGTFAGPFGERIDRTLDVRQTAHMIMSGPFQTGADSYAVKVIHPPFTYTVQYGDVFYDIAYLHRFPQWQLEQANPDVDPGAIDVGQVLTIPSVDVLFPYPVVPGKRIEVNLPTQILRAFELDNQVFEFRVSSGISTTPTIAGQFQVLFKEDNAFARRWELDMPFFVGFFEYGPGFYNGFHELPVTSYGARLRRSVLGYPASYGCIILDIDDAEALYNWAEIGTYVRVAGVAPGTPFGQQTLLDIAPPVEEPAP